MRKRRLQVAVGVAIAGALLGGVAVAVGDFGGRNIRETLSGFEEVPVVSTGASGEFRAWINRSGEEINYRASYADLTGDVTQAHIHLGQKSVNGGIAVWLCGNVPNTPAGVQPCPPAPATITGTITAENVSDLPAQGLAAGELEELLRAVRAGVTYVNVHSSTFPGGEVRSQLDTHHDW